MPNVTLYIERSAAYGNVSYWTRVIVDVKYRITSRSINAANSPQAVETIEYDIISITPNIILTPMDRKRLSHRIFDQEQENIPRSAN